MIEVTIDSLPLESEQKLRKLLTSDGIAILKRVAEAQVKKNQVKALRDAIQSSPQNSMIDVANINLAQAQRFQTFLNVLDLFCNQNSPFEIVRLT